MPPLPRRQVLAAPLLLLAGMSLFGHFASHAQAAPAIVLKNPGLCVMAGADENGNLIVGGLGVATTIIENGNKIHFICQGKGLINRSGKAQHFKGFLCSFIVPSGGIAFSFDSMATVAANGNGMLKCTFTYPK